MKDTYRAIHAAFVLAWENLQMIDALQDVLEQVVAPLVRGIGLRVVRASQSEVTLAMPVVPHVIHGGGVLCGQAIMGAMDTAMVLALVAHAGGKYRPMTTVQLQTSFLRGVPADAGEVTLVSRVLRAGRSLAFGEIHLTTPDGKLAAHATTTYALL
jgi:uncharacterized protein (TIGR00369 family)